MSRHLTVTIDGVDFDLVGHFVPAEPEFPDSPGTAADFEIESVTSSDDLCAALGRADLWDDLVEAAVAACQE